MRTITFFLATLLFAFNLTAQDKGFVHTTTIANTTNQQTIIDHPDLNGNPNANVLFCQRFIGAGTDNNNPTGIYYVGNNWRIYNENIATMPIGVQFNIYIADDSVVTTHIADASNTGGNLTGLDGAITENDYLFSSNYWNPNQVYNPYVYGSWYLSGERKLYTETVEDVPLGAAFKVMRGMAISATRGTEISETGNIYVNRIEIDHPALNNNPDAVFLYNHYLGGPNHEPEYSVYLPYVTEAYYTNGHWNIYAYDAGTLPEGIWIDFIIPDEILDTQSIEQSQIAVTAYPNPVDSHVSFSSKTSINEVEIYTLTGQKMDLEYTIDITSATVNISALASGVYIAKIKTDEGVGSIRLIKK